MRGLRSCLVLVFLFCFAAMAEEVAPGLHFSGEFLVSVRNPSALRTDTLEGIGWSVRTLATVRSQGETEALDDAVEKTWLLFSPPGTESVRSMSSEHPWDSAHRRIASRTEGVFSDFLENVDATQIVEIEPVVAYEMRGIGDRFAEATAREESSARPCPVNSGGLVVSCSPASFQWPNVQRVSWHQDDDRTELRKARTRAQSFFERGPVVRIAHLDTGYYPTQDTITPVRFNTSLSQSFIPDDRCGPTGIDCYQGGLPNGHGPSTLSVLAGGKVKFAASNNYPEYNDYLGGAPLAEVFTYRVSPSVILLWPLHVGQGILSAVGNDADVISMSMGGVPSYFLRDAVNTAYDSGVPMFFAAADFVRLPIPIIPVEVPPHTMVYPARFTTATPVSGMTAKSRSYGLNPSWFLSVFRGQAFSWMLRGSYGPAHLMKDRALTTMSPNITARYGTTAFPANQVKFSFAGTSAATPQAAAAAALWLQVHRGEFSDAEWRSWVKTQSAYDALTKSASLPRGRNNVERFGAGLLQANKALDIPRPANPVKRPPGQIGVDWITFLAAILGIGPGDPKPTGQEAEVHRSMLQLEVAQLLTTEPELRDIVNGDFESTPTRPQLRRLARALERHPRASSYLRRAVAEGPAR